MAFKVDGPTLLNSWAKACAYPGGRTLFHLFIKRLIPYTGALGAEVVELSRGKAVVQLKDRRSVRNHLSSVHAMALANLAEFSTGLAVICSLPAGMRGILKGFQIDYLKKSRGTLTAISEFSSEIHFDNKSDSDAKHDIDVKGYILNSDQEKVAEVKALWRISKEK